ncbi:MAG: FGGY-family carbohydrate kinase [Spirosomataceae bacterium]
MKPTVCAVFDIGKTNKKVLLFDKNYQVIEEKITQFEEVLDDDGFRADDLLGLTNWLKTSFAELKQRTDIDLKAVNFATYGASLVHLNAEGKPLTPLYNYLKDFPRSLKNQFYEKYGPVEEFCAATASPDSGMLNSGLQLYWLKNEKPQIFHQIRYSLHLPQYCSFLFTNNPISEITSIGCHTALWDFQKNDYHAWVEAEHLHSIQQKPLPSSSSSPLSRWRGAGGEVNEVALGIGIHDSSSSLVPYLKAFDEEFVLLSTGTWCISLNPFNEEPLTVSELERDCLSYMNYLGKPVKASRLFAGNEHERQIKHLASYFNTDIDYYKQVQFNRDLIWDLRHRFKQATPNSADTGLLRDCPFVERNINLFRNYEEAYHQFILDLVAQQVASLKMAIGYTNVRKIFVDGGFSRNDIFMNLLAEAFFDKEVYASEIAQATALGAALVVSEVWNDKPFDRSGFELRRYFA